MGAGINPLPWMVSDPNRPGSMINSPQGGTPMSTAWTSPNGLTTTGIMNPFGLSANNPSVGYYGANPSQNVNPFLTANPQYNANGDMAPFGFGNTDPTGDARRAAAYPGGVAPPVQGGGYVDPFAPVQLPSMGGGGAASNSYPGAGSNLSNTIFTDQNGQKMVFVNGQWTPFTGQAGFTQGTGAITNSPTTTGTSRPTGTPSIAPTTPNPNDPFSYLSNVNVNAGVGSNIVSQGANPFQFADPASAQRMAQLLGGQAIGTNLQGPGMGYSQDMQQILFPNGNQMNAGLAGGVANMYGMAPGSYGEYLLNRDKNGTYGAASPWDNGPINNTTGSIGTGESTGTAFGGSGAGSMFPGTPNIFTGPFGGQMANESGYGLAGPGGGQTFDPSSLFNFLSSLSGGTPDPGRGSINGLSPNGPYGYPANPLGMPPNQGGTPDQFLADQANNTGYLSNIAQNAGFAANATPAWQAMVAQQQRGLDRHFADLQASFAGSGNRFSTDFGNAATDYWNQAALDQNSLLGQMTFASQESARQRELGAAQSLNQTGFQGASQLSNQAFQSQMQQQNQSLQAAMAFMGAGAGAAGQMAGIGAQGAQALQQGAVQGAQGLFGAENAAAMNEIMRQITLQQMGLGASSDLSRLWQSNLNLGSQLGQQQYAVNGMNLQQQYNEWMRTQPYNSPLMQMIYQSATGYPPTTQPQYRPSIWESLLGSAGGILGGIGGLIP